MNFSRIKEKIIFVASLPEMKIFWFFLPLALISFIIASIYLASFLFLVDGTLIVAMAAIVFASAYKVAQVNHDTLVERNELKSVVFDMEDALIAYDKNFKILFFNPAAEKLFKISAEMVVGKELTPQDVESPVFRLLAQVIFPSLSPSMVLHSKAGSMPQITDLAFENPHLDLRTLTATIDDGSGSTLGFVKIIRDRTTEIELMRSKNDFITVASHQLRGPVTNISWALEALSKDAGVSSEAKDIVDHALDSGHELLRIIEDLLNISKIEEGRFGYNFQETDLLAFLNGILSEALPQARRSGIKIYFERPQTPLPQVTIDPQKLSMAFSNLIENAVRYNVENGEVTVSVKKMEDKPFAEVSIKDTGIGIPSEQMEKLFTKFFRADNAVKFQTQGSGLGLYIVKNIIQAHGGQVWVESEVNRGTTFHFTVPLDPTLIPPKEVPSDF